MTERRTDVLVGALVVVVVFCAGWPGLDNGFLNYDDPDVVIDNPRLDDPSVIDVVDVFGEIRGHAYLPLYYVGLMPEAALAGKTPRVFHLGSLIWHAANALLLLALVRRIAGSRLVAVAAACVFATHPVAVESVAWVSGRKDQVSLLFVLIGLLSWMNWLERGGAGRFACAAGLMFLGCFAKGTVVVFPALAGLLAVHAYRTGSLSLGRRIVPALGLLLLLASIPAGIHLRIAALEGTAGVGATHTMAEGVPLFFASLQLYAQHLVLPVALSIHYHLPPGEIPGLTHLTGVLVLLALVGGVILHLRGRLGVAGLALGWILVALLPFNNIFPRTSVVAADRYLALALPGFGLLVGSLLSRFPSRIGRSSLLVLVTLLAALSASRTEDFEDGETVFRRAMEVDPDDPLPPAQVAEALLARSMASADRTPLVEEALGLLSRSLGLAERSGDSVRVMRARLRYADTLLRAGRFQLGQAEFGQALESMKGDQERFEALGVDPLTLEHNLAQCQIGCGLVRDGKARLIGILSVDREHPHARVTLAGLNLVQGFENLGRYAQADLVDRARTQVNRGIADLRRLRRELRDTRVGQGPWDRTIAPELEPEVLKRLGEALLSAGWMEAGELEAVGCAGDLVRLYPNEPHGWLLRARIMEVQGEAVPDILAELVKAHEADRDDVGIILRLARILLGVGENRRAMNLLVRARALRPESSEVRNMLGSMFLALGRKWHNSEDGERALRAGLQARELLPEALDVWLLLGQVHEAANRWKQAEQAYRRVIEQASDHGEARLGLARYYQARGIAGLSEMKVRVANSRWVDREQVQRNLEDLVASSYRLALEYAAGARDVAIARRWLAKRRRSGNDVARPLRDQGWRELVNGDGEVAVELLRRAVRTDGLDVEGCWMLAEALRRLSLAPDRPADLKRTVRTEALAAVESALALDPEHLPSLYLASDLYYVKGAWEKVRQVSLRFLALARGDKELTTERVQVTRRLELAKDR